MQKIIYYIGTYGYEGIYVKKNSKFKCDIYIYMYDI